jgi:hypothetical protein
VVERPQFGDLKLLAEVDREIDDGLADVSIILNDQIDRGRQ